MRKSRSILEELNAISTNRDKHCLFENRAEHIIDSAINLITEMERTYSPEVAKDLHNRLINSIKGRDGAKFKRGIRKVKGGKTDAS